MDRESVLEWLRARIRELEEELRVLRALLAVLAPRYPVSRRLLWRLGVSVLGG